MHDIGMRCYSVKHTVGVALIVLLSVCVCVLGERLHDANRKAEASRMLLNRVFNDKFKYYCDTLMHTGEYGEYSEAYHIGDAVIE